MRDVRFTPELLRRIPPVTARMYSVNPIADKINGIVIATPHPFKLEVVDELKRLLGRDIEIRCADPDQISGFIKKHYGGDSL